MTGFRGSDQALEREIAAVQALARTRLRRATDDLRELEVVLDELRKERRRRQLPVGLAVPSDVPGAASA